jgi:mono/diheme cytochrome c family protein
MKTSVFSLAKSTALTALTLGVTLGVALGGFFALSSSDAIAAAADNKVIPLTSGLALPPLDPERGKMLFASKGCVDCHAVNGVGGTDAPAIDAGTMAPEMNPFDFVVKMWNHAPGMIAMQQSELGGQVTFKNGQELADIIAFLHDAKVQKTFSKQDLSAEMREHLDEDDDSMPMHNGTMMNNGNMMNGGAMMNGQGRMHGNGTMPRNSGTMMNNN